MMGASNEKLFMFCQNLRKILLKLSFLNVCIEIYQPIKSTPDNSSFSFNPNVEQHLKHTENYVNMFIILPNVNRGK